MEYIAFFFSSTIKLFALMTPPAVLGAFLGGTRTYDMARKRSTALRTATAVFIIGITLYLLGEPIFNLFDISLNAFRIGAGALLFMTAVSLMQDTPERPSLSSTQDISVVPLAIPLCMGPATIGTIMVWGAADHSISHKIITALALFCASSGIYVMLRFADKAERVLKRTGIEVLAKLTGLLLAAIAAQVIFTGIRNFLR